MVLFSRLSLIPCAVSEVGEALKMSSGDFEGKYGFPLPAKDAAIVTHCLKGLRGAKARDAMKEAGFTNVDVYMGSFEDWKSKGGQVE